METEILAIGPHVWGRGETEDEAFQNAKDAGIPWGYFDGDAEIAMLRVPAETYVTDFGGLRHDDCTQEEFDEVYEELGTRTVRRPSGRR
jgi:hypothetical protein